MKRAQPLTKPQGSAVRQKSSLRAVVPPEPTHWPGWRVFWTLFGIIIILLILRRPDSITQPQFWAEDGNVFFSSQLLNGFWKSAFIPYNGYICLAQRIVAAFASWFPIQHVPLLYAACGSAIASLCCSVFVLPHFRLLLRSDTLRATVCVLMAITPRSNEMIGTLVNMPWYLLVAGTLLVFRDDPRGISSPVRRTLELMGLGVLALVLALTMPVLVVCVPFCFWNIVKKWRADRIYEICLLLGLLYQFWHYTATNQVPPDVGPMVRLDLMIASVIVGFVYRVVLTVTIGYDVAMVAAAAKVMSLPMIAVISTVVWITILFLKADVHGRKNVVSALYIAGSSLAITLAGRHMSPAFANINDFKIIDLDRYFLLATCVCLYLLALSVETLLSNRRVAIQFAVLACTTAMGTAVNYRIPAFPNTDWPAYASAIQQRVDRKQLGSGLPPIVVPILPKPWVINIP